MNRNYFKTLICLLSLSWLSAFGAPQTVQVLFLDFGPNDGVNGNSTVGVASNGASWNNINNSSNTAPAVNLVDKFNKSTNIKLYVTGGMSTNGILNGALLNPSANLLGDLAVNTATQDYFHTSDTGRLSLRGLDPNKGYRLTLFASRDTTERRTTRYTVQGSTSHSYWLQSSGANIGTNVANSNDDSVIKTEIYQPTSNGEIQLVIARAANSFAYLNAMKIEVVDGMNFPAARPAVNASCASLDANKIALMGSSVAWGHGADNPGGPFDHYISFGEDRSGYSFHFSKFLDSSYNSALANQGIERRWWITNVAISGDTTTKVLARWEKDLLPQCAKYVLYGLSLANEGIINDASAFDRFRTNMQTIIQKTRANGMVPIFVNNYGNNSYDQTRYNRIIDMDLLIHKWDVPSVNVLGALDDLQGHFASGYYFDGGHPNNSGYYEMYATIVPSLFAALDANKPRPAKMATSSIALKPGQKVDFQPEGDLRSMTFVVDINTRSSNGDIATFATANGTAKLRVNSSGRLEYVSANSANVATSSSAVNDGAWHTVSFTHHYAQGVSQIFVDGQHQGNSVGERIQVRKFTLDGQAFNGNLSLRNLFFYRSGMTEREMVAIKNGELLQSSMELYAPLNGQGNVSVSALENVAQSTNTLKLVSSSGPVTLYQHCNYEGYSVGLSEGSYTLSQLISLGVANDDISSLRVQSGYKIVMYQHHDFTGTTLTKTAEDACLVDDGYNDDISSVVISRVAGAWSTRIEAEGYVTASDIGTESCSEGGQNIGWLDAGDWVVWDINLPSTGAYRVDYRIAGLTSGTIQLERAGGAPVYGQVNVPMTGGWQTWQTVSHTVNLDAGQQQIAINVPAAGFNINWIQFTKL